MINVCVVTFNRYDLLRKLLLSLQVSTLRPTSIWIVDNGRNAEKMLEATEGIPDAFVVPIHPDEGHEQVSQAAAFNWFLKNVPEERVISNDDVVFASDSLQIFADTPGDVVVNQYHGCMLIRDSCIEKIGYYDETISPGYLFFEDCDYFHRMHLAGIEPTLVDTHAVHGVEQKGSQSIQAFTEDQWNRHHPRFLRAQANYVAKWGGMPVGGPRGLWI